ncbi:hypothetical protein [Epilithonimonas arachidiradicis]|uniref:Uncharacterized protein n=1 Tax=Epilithonimonas arachidiradicis TaxID=1617282 RepID=A0A420D9F2_9FLAO|nr:hypothetical protein [Epilithonimonas arachidiradicis]RKE87208.1 hypothetical protein BXY58_2084 [Epilithonimonas arachidiradicis]
MKKLFLIFATGLLFSCNSNKSSETSESVSPDSTSMDTQPSSSTNGGTSIDSAAASSNNATGTTSSRTDSASTSNRDSVRVR